MHSANDRATPVPLKTMTMKLPPGWFYAALIVVLSAWILHSFLQAMAAEAGDAEAMNSLGVLYFIGTQVPRDYATALLWLQKEHRRDRQ